MISREKAELLAWALYFLGCLVGYMVSKDRWCR